MAVASPLQIDPSLGSLLTENAMESKFLQPEATKLPASSVIVTDVNDQNMPPSSVRNSETDAEPRLAVDPAALKAKYDAERDKRLAANPAGLNQYRTIHHDDPVFGKYLLDPYIKETISRGPIEVETEVLVIGGGYGGQLVTVRLIEKGITNIRIVEKGGDFGGTW